MDVPAEGMKFHDQHHLRSCDIHCLRVIEDLAVDMVDRHVAHEKDEPNPGHQRAIHIVGNGIGTGCAVKKCTQAIPEVEKTDKVEERDTDNERVLFPRLGVGDPFQQGGEWIGEQE
jgi:hypothetical protein